MISLDTILSTLVLAQAEAPKGPQGIFGNPLTMFALMAVIFYFLLIRPQQRQRKEQQARIAALQNGDKVITTAGIHGIVHNVKDTTVVVKVGEGNFLEFDKPAIATVRKKDTEAK
ncbi:MAG TPA: preprotein translocase subunit YajC [Luteolibacter sp.]|nr:preprotein translocase subunit YajC [Luteolibacter sp.]